MTLTPQEIQDNWNEFLKNIETYITGNRKNQLLDFYKKHEDRVALMPAANMAKYHSCFAGGYVYHVNKVVKASLYLQKLWTLMGASQESYTTEELVFSAINHDLGKAGDLYNEAYLPSTDKWRIENLGELYTHNTKLSFMSIPDRSLFLLQQAEIGLSQNEWIAIKTHDGLYDAANEAYFKPFTPEARFRTVMPHILHQADMLASVIEFEQQFQTEKKLIK
jgi:hypothetical protein